jgi:hypothetical protein
MTTKKRRNTRDQRGVQEMLNYIDSVGLRHFNSEIAWYVSQHDARMTPALHFLLPI